MKLLLLDLSQLHKKRKEFADDEEIQALEKQLSEIKELKAKKKKKLLKNRKKMQKKIKDKH